MSCRTARHWTKALEIAEVINNNGPLAVQAILKTIRETEGMHENDAFKIDTKNGIGGVPVRRRQGRPAGVQGEARPQLPDEVARPPNVNVLRKISSILAVGSHSTVWRR